ncbi:hypothetical protein ACH5RR_006307 [Cinchona calisaya]|uniref:Uncharacterized protein n=1 Tax=Cinchona calisaya TaxID=153742 RepID=A0ABD3ANM8_9GENT
MLVVSFKISSFLTNSFTSTFKATRKPNYVPVRRISCCRHTYTPDDDHTSSSSKKNENQLAKLAVVTLAAGVLALNSVDPASAAKTGGRVGGQAFKSSAPRSSSPRINNSRTNIFVNPPVAPPLVGGYGYGFGVPFYGGWGWTPFSFFAPGPSVAIGVGGGFEVFLLFLVLGAVSAVIRRFLASREEDFDDY